jgi:hypothetical protein
MLGLAAIAAVGIVVPVTAPAQAETVKKVIIKKHGDRGHHYGWRNRNRTKVIVRHRDRDHNVGYHRHHGSSRVVIKKKVVRD